MIEFILGVMIGNFIGILVIAFIAIIIEIFTEDPVLEDVLDCIIIAALILFGVFLL